VIARDRTVESQRLLSEQIIEQRADVKAIRATLESADTGLKAPAAVTPAAPNRRRR